MNHLYTHHLGSRGKGPRAFTNVLLAIASWALCSAELVWWVTM